VLIWHAEIPYWVLALSRHRGTDGEQMTLACSASASADSHTRTYAHTHTQQARAHTQGPAPTHLRSALRAPRCVVCGLVRAVCGAAAAGSGLLAAGPVA
jgi:hypothetical protein